MSKPINSITNNNNNNSNNNNNIFINKIWNNIFIQKNIKYHLKLYNCYRYDQYISLNNTQIDIIKNYPHLQYIRSLVIFDINKSTYQLLLQVLRHFKSFGEVDSITLFQEDLLNSQIKELLYEFKSIDGIIFQENTIPLSCGIVTSNVKKIIFEFLETNQPLSYHLSSNNSTLESQNSQFISIFPTFGLTKLFLGQGFDSIIEAGTLPLTLKHLTFNNCYNQCLLENSLPANIESIIFGTNFNQPINHLRKLNKLFELSLGRDFNQNIQGMLPINLKKCTINGSFIIPQREDNEDNLVFPNSIETLELNTLLNEHYIFKLPTSLKNLVVFNNYFENNRIDFINHNTNLKKIYIILKKRFINYGCLQQTVNNYSDIQLNFFKLNNYNNLKRIELSSTISELFHEKLESNIFKEYIEIQSKIKKLKILIMKSGSLDFLNSKIKFKSIEKLEINLFGEIYIEKVLLPLTLKSIIFSSRKGHFSLGNDVLLNCNNLTSIHLDSFNNEIKRSMFPVSLLNLELVNYSKQLNQDSLPTSLISLKLLSTLSLDTTILPSGLRIFYTESIQLPKIQDNKQWLPNQILYLLINNEYIAESLSNINNSNLPTTLKAIYFNVLNHDLLNNNHIYKFINNNLDLITVSNKLNPIYKQLVNNSK